MLQAKRAWLRMAIGNNKMQLNAAKHGLNTYIYRKES